MDLALNNLQRLICHKTKQTKPNLKLKKKVSDTFSSYGLILQKYIHETLSEVGFFFEYLTDQLQKL